LAKTLAMVGDAVKVTINCCIIDANLSGSMPLELRRAAQAPIWPTATATALTRSLGTSKSAVTVVCWGSGLAMREIQQRAGRAVRTSDDAGKEQGQRTATCASCASSVRE
jgi:hypothetical protein